MCFPVLSEEEIAAHCLALIEQAKAWYPLPKKLLKNVEICCDLRGKASGKAEFYYKFGRLSRSRLRFNLQAAQLDPDGMLSNTLPHEVAHLVVRFLPKLFDQQPHGPHWQAICRRLGGNGQTYHQLSLTPARIYRRWHYRDTSGETHLLTTIRHRRIQQGRCYKVASTGAMIEASGWIEQGAV